jgi:D-alanine transfer protein
MTRTPHLLPAAAALLLAAAALAGWLRYARRAERRAVHALAVAAVPDLPRYRALQAEALRQPDLLPVYGSSEVIWSDPYHASTLLGKRPTGFLPFPVGERGGCSLLHVQKLAGLGPQLRGKRVVVSFTATCFRQPTARPQEYAGNFSRLDANELAFSTGLSHGVKRAVARRMLHYPRTLDDDSLLRFALDELAEGSTTGDALYLAALPLGKLQTLVLRLQDHWASLGLIRGRQPAGPTPAKSAASSTLDWAALAEQAEQHYRPRTRSNPFGIDDQVWASKVFSQVTRSAPPASRDGDFRHGLRQSQEWADLAVLLRALRELGAEPLLICTPLRGNYLEHCGVSPEARRTYYRRLRALARSHGVPAVDFADHDQDPFFLCDTSHLSSKGWVYYAYALDAFYHGRRPLRLAPGLLSARADPVGAPPRPGALCP